MLPDFFFCSLFPVQQTTSGIGHRSFFGLATNTLNVRNNNNNNNIITVFIRAPACSSPTNPLCVFVCTNIHVCVHVCVFLVPN